MKKNILLVSVVALLGFACSNNVVSPSNSDNGQTTARTETFVYQGTEYVVQYHIDENGTAVPVQDEAYNKVKSIVEAPNSGSIDDPDDPSKVWLYKDNSEIPAAKAAMIKDYNSKHAAATNVSKELAKTTSTADYCDVYKDANFSGAYARIGYDISDLRNSYYFNYGGGMDKNISCIKVVGYQGNSVIIYDDYGYQGRSKTMVCVTYDSKLGTYTTGMNDMSKYVRYYYSIFNSKSWNDCVSSIYFPYYW